MHTNVVSANKLGGALHHNDNISNLWLLNSMVTVQGFRNMQHDSVAQRHTIFASYLKEN